MRGAVEFLTIAFLVAAQLLPLAASTTEQAPADCVPVDPQDLGPPRYNQDIQRRWNAWSRETTGACLQSGPSIPCAFEDASGQEGVSVCWWGFSPPSRPTDCVDAQPSGEEARQWQARLSTYTRGVCQAPDESELWKCYGVLHEGDATLCWWPAQLSVAQNALNVALDLEAVRLLAADTLWLGESKTLIGEGAKTFDVTLGESRIRVDAVDLKIQRVRYASMPAGCVAVDPARLDRAQADPATAARWQAWSASEDVCRLSRAPYPGECVHADFQDAFGVTAQFQAVTQELLCWWGRPVAGTADLSANMGEDAFRSIANAQERGPLVRHLLKESYIALSARDPVKQAAIRTLLQAKIGDAPAPEPATDESRVVNRFGTLIGFANPPKTLSLEDLSLAGGVTTSEYAGVLTVEPGLLQDLATLEPRLSQVGTALDDAAQAAAAPEAVAGDGPPRPSGYQLGQQAFDAAGEFLLRQGFVGDATDGGSP